MLILQPITKGVPRYDASHFGGISFFTSKAELFNGRLAIIGDTQLHPIHCMLRCSGLTTFFRASAWLRIVSRGTAGVRDINTSYGLRADFLMHSWSVIDKQMCFFSRHGFEAWCCVGFPCLLIQELINMAPTFGEFLLCLMCFKCIAST